MKVPNRQEKSIFGKAILAFMALILFSCTSSGESVVSDTDIESTSSPTSNRTLDTPTNPKAIPFTPDLVLEAEKGLLTGVKVGGTRNKASGIFYVTGFDEKTDVVSFTVFADSKLRTAIVVTGAVTSGWGSKTNDLYVNNKKVGEFITPDTGDWVRSNPIPVVLQKGENSISVRSNWGWFDLDCLSFQDPEDLSSYYEVSARLVTEEPLPEAKKLFDYLKSIYGKKTLSGQMDLTWNDKVSMVDRVFTDTGKYPALQGFDFMNMKGSYSGKNQTGEALAWWRNGAGTGKNGIVAFCWHWRDPRSSGDAGEFYTNKTSFRIPYDKGRNAWRTESTEFKTLMKDIHRVAVELKVLQDAGVPVLWRPLHEASGGWFWWGASGPEPYLALWDLLFQELNGTHQLKNLIWVWNGQHGAWYPGDSTVDIIGEDIYPGPRNYGSSAGRFIEATKYAGEKKMIALSENGAIPHPDNLAEDMVRWLYFMTWNDAMGAEGEDREDSFWTGEFHNDDAHKKAVYSHQDIITLDELPPLGQ